MSKRNSIINTPLRRSARLLHHHNNSPDRQDPNTHNSKLTNNRIRSSNPPINSKKSDSSPKTHQHCPKIKTSKETCRLTGGSRKSPRFNGGISTLHSLRRSPRFANNRNVEQFVKKRSNDKSKRTSEVKSNKHVECGSDKSKRKGKVGVNQCEEMDWIKLSIVVGLKAIGAKGGEMKQREVVKESEEITVKRKRKRGEEGTESGKIQGWTKEQELALQRAYFTLKPTPHFWKKVSKLVPGKSAQDCFDKVHSDHITPPQPGPRSRANKMTSPPVEHFSLSASKLLKPFQPKIKRSSCNKQKSHLAQKTVRHLLQKNYHVDKDHEADLFSVLEPQTNSSTQAYEQNGLLSTPKLLQGNQEFLQKHCDRSSGQKKSLSRFSGSCEMTLVSPPVLKQVKNRALHEKYIDQLHSREAKRKAASARAERIITGKKNRREIPGLKLDVVRAAKNALVTDAQNAIDQLQHLHANTMSNSSDFDCDAVSCDDDEGESEL